MSQVSFMEKLFDGLEVELKALEKVYKFQYGMGNTIPTLGGEYPVYGSNGIVGTHNEFNSEDSPVIGHIGAYAGIVNWGKGKHFVTYNGVICKLINDSVNSKYAYYQLLKQDFNSMAKSASHPFVSYAALNKVLIPIPPLEIQTEIVRILDNFTELIAELTAELHARKKQYSYYRDQLLNFDEGDVEWKAIEIVFNILAGGDVPQDALSNIETEEFNIPILSNGIDKKSLYGWTNKAKIEKPSLTISARGTIGWTSFQNKPFFPIVRLLVLTPKVKLNLKYAYYYLKSIENNYNVPKNGIPQLTKPMINNIKIPIPSLTEQARIVAILDKFDTLTNSISEGLPKEIELRQKQYEYYRDMLLSFPQPKIEA